MAKKRRPLAERVKRDPALLKRALADPGNRAKLPDRYLNPTQLRQRRDRQFTSDLGDITTGLSGPTMVRTAETLVDKDFAPLLEDIGRQEKRTLERTDEQQRHLNNYYTTANAAIDRTIYGQHEDNMRGVLAARNRGLDNIGSIDRSASEASQRIAQDAQVRGEGLGGDQLSDLAQRQAEQRMRASQEATRAEDNAQSYGAAADAFLRSTQAATAQQGGEQSAQIQARGQTTLSDLAAERAKARTGRQGALTETLLKMRGGEVERHLTERGLANDQEKALLDYRTEMAGLRTKAQTDAANRRLKLRLTQMGLSSQEAQNEIDNETSRLNNAATNATSRRNTDERNRQSDINSRRSSRGRTGGRSSFTPQQRRSAADKRDTAISFTQTLRQRGVKRGDALIALTQKYGSTYARVAVGAIYDGGAKPHLNNLLQQRAGVSIPEQYRR